MKILAVDMGTGTQDILLFDSRVDVENSLKMVQPSPTMIAHGRIKNATRRGEPVLLTGVTMGGGPSNWAADAHLKAGLPLYATPDAARSFNDDLELVRASGVTVIGEDEISRLSGRVIQIELKDLDIGAIRAAFGHFDVSLDDLDVVAAAVFDHGAAPPGYSDRQFRFDYLARRVQENPRLSAFAYLRDEIPEIMTRMQAVARAGENMDARLVLMDTAPAAVLGAMQDNAVRRAERAMLVNIGNFHTIAFRTGPEGVEGVFEHHTGMLDTIKLDGLLEKFSRGELAHEEVFEDHGHGALILSGRQLDTGRGDFGVAVTGPRWAMMSDSRLRPYFAAPYGDMMMAGCYGMVKAVGELLPEYSEEIFAALGQGREKPPWELE